MPENVVVQKSTGKICPFQLFNKSGSMAIGTTCITTACQLWVENTNSDDKFSVIVGTNNPDGVIVDDGTPAFLQENGRCGLQTADFAENTFRINHHLHRHHEHPRAHSSAKKIPLQDGGFFMGTAIPKAFQLIQEMQIGEDVDGNGKIFGKDFDIDLNADAPMVLGSMGDLAARNAKVRVTWENFNANKFPPQIRSIYPSKWNCNGGARIRVIGGFFSGTLEDFKIIYKVKRTDGHITQITLTIDDINIVNSNKLFFTIPTLSPTPPTSASVQISFINKGDTFDMFNDFIDFLTNTGGTTVLPYKKRFFDDSDQQDDPDIQAAILEDEENSSTLPPSA